ncbi:MAG: hypothetical protein ACTHJ4_08595 [Candidatus Nucleicultricaceae bacterium]
MSKYMIIFLSLVSFSATTTSLAYANSAKEKTSASKPKPSSCDEFSREVGMCR